MNFAYKAINQHRANLFQIVFLAIVSIFGLPAIAAAQVTITQSSSQTITAQNSVTCNNAGLTADNSFWRAFTLSSFGITSAFAVQSISFGIEQANAAGTGTTQPIDVRIYANSGAAFPGGTRSLLQTVSINLADQTGTVLSVPITATIPAGNQLVLEIHVPDGIAAGHQFFPGSNAAAETGPSYISAASCGITTPTTYAAIGFPNVHLVMNVTGQAVTAAAVLQIGGQVLAPNGKGISGAVVTLSDISGSSRQIRTNPFGNFKFDDLNSGETYIISATGKGYRFNPQAVNLTQNVSDLKIIAEP